MNISHICIYIHIYMIYKYKYPIQGVKKKNSGF